ncbi:hypothetical protein P3X46_005550 [Hevea brasiliensis]|uniref:DUF7731 domain-containing protein n=1 Tax=Hevea brasiliensis TaxID=3981 RepID=A0ABQ9N0A4_HEVBR|nr:hypothetical protein P3X46_005550 [Hevea brasiliensis]
MTLRAVLMQKIIFIFPLISIAKFCCYSGYAQDVPGQTVGDALFCFNNKIYNGCDEAFGLTLSRNINVPPEATDVFCNGPCLTQTQAILNCIDSVLSDFLFYNGATVRDIRNILRTGCSYASLRGNFNVARDIHRLPNLLGIFASTWIIVLSLLVL